jgi:hypothetical protein
MILNVDHDDVIITKGGDVGKGVVVAVREPSDITAFVSVRTPSHVMQKA